MIPKTLIAFVAVLFLSFGPVTAGYLGGDLQDTINFSSADSFIRVAIRPYSDMKSGSLKKSLEANFKIPAERYRAGIEILKNEAELTQPPILERLAELEIQGKARNIQGYWITNLIEAEVMASSLDDLASDGNIDIIELVPAIEVIPPVKSAQSKVAAGVETNLQVIGADQAWALGYDGTGSLVCSFDTGVDGDHVSLTGNYRGNKGYDAAECWFSPVDSTTYPHYFEGHPSSDHGTHTAGIMVGHDDANGDTIGVAPGADWIAAVAIDTYGSSVFAAWQWAADPDGNPNTTDDLPDVINHSWGITDIGCADIFWEAIDNTEALGIVNIFAAGNAGSTASTITVPANRAEDSLTNFAVGSIRNDSTIYSTSSRGPSDCDGTSVKPNVVAPGSGIYSSIPSETHDTYGYMTGTSMAAPHASGAVAILRQKNPAATVDEIKEALLVSAYDLGDAGKDNDYGWGMIDMVAALNYISAISSPSLEISYLTYPEISPGDAVNLDISLFNSGTDAVNVTADFSNPESGVTINTSSISFGDINQGSTATGTSTLDLQFDSGVETGKFYSLDIDVYIDGALHLHGRLSFLIGSKGERTYFNHDAGAIQFTISNYGAYGFHGTNTNNALTGSYLPYDFLGFQFARDTNDLYEGALVLGTDADHISDAAQNFVLEPDNDFYVIPGGSIVASDPGSRADQETVSIFSDAWAENPLGVTITQKSYGWSTSPDDEYIIMEYIITNDTNVTISDLRVGLFFDWDIPPSGSNHGKSVTADDLGYLCYYNGADSLDFRGVKILNDEGLVNHRIYNFWTEIWDGLFSETNKYLGLFDNSNAAYTATNEVAHITATGPFTLAPGSSDTAVFAIVGGVNWTDFTNNADLAAQKYDVMLDVDDWPVALPGKFVLHQNYPNPFNPKTKIAFDLPRSARVTVDVFDILGRRVATLMDENLEAGPQETEWDGTNDNGRSVASGIYFYRVSYDKVSQTKKMLLIK